MRSASGSGRPGSTMISLTPGSARSGSRSSKLAMRGRRGTAMTKRAVARSRALPRARGRPRRAAFAASAKCGTGPRHGTPVRSAMKVLPSAKSVGSPWKRLTSVAAISAGVGGIDHREGADERGDDAAAVDVADDDDRHIRRRGQSRSWRCRCARRLTSDALPAPSTRTRSASAASSRNAASTSGSSSPRFFQYSRAGNEPTRLPRTMSCAPVVVLGLQQHRVHRGHRLAPRGPRLQRLRPADLAAVGGHRGVVAHVLRLERRDAQPAIGEGAAEAGDDQRLADVRAGSHEHESASHGARSSGWRRDPVGNRHADNPHHRDRGRQPRLPDGPGDRRDAADRCVLHARQGRGKGRAQPHPQRNSRAVRARADVPHRSSSPSRRGGRPRRRTIARASRSGAASSRRRTGGSSPKSWPRARPGRSSSGAIRRSTTARSRSSTT